MLAGNRLAIRRYVRKASPKFAIGIIAISLGVTLIAYAARPQPFGDVLLLFGEILAIYAVLALVIGLALLFLAPHQRAKKNFKQIPALSREQTVSWDDASISFISGYGNVSFPIADMHQWAADDGIVILYPADHIFYMLPSRVFENERDRESLMAALERSPVPRL
jgi:hypothetical protein